MILTLPDFNLSTTPVPFGVIPPSNLQASQINWIRYLNESSYTLQMQAGGVSVPIPAWTDYPIQISKNGQVIGSFGLPISVTATQFSANPNLSTILRVSFYNGGDVPASTVPIPLVRQTWIPNPVSIVSGAVASSILNDTNSAGFQIVEAQVAGDGVGSAVVLTNNGNLALGNATRTGSFTMLGGGAQVGSLATSTINGPAVAADITVNASTAHKIIEQVNAVTVLSTDVNGLTLASASFLILSSPAAQSLAVNSGITLSGTRIVVTESVNVTGITMPVGTLDGQLVILENIGNFTVTFAAAGSHVRGNSNITFNAGRLLMLTWNTSLGLWVPGPNS
jgi:hypothetical protein